MSASELVTGSQMNLEIQCFVSARIYESAAETRVIIADIYEYAKILPRSRRNCVEGRKLIKVIKSNLFSKINIITYD